MNTKNDVLKVLDKIQSDQLKTCVKNGRYAVCTIVGTVWGLLLQNGVMEKCDDKLIYIKGQYINGISLLLLLLTLALAVAYFCIEAWRLCDVGNEAKKIHEKLCKNVYDEIEAQVLMNIKSDWALKIFKRQLLLCIPMLIFLSLYVILMLFMK